MGIKKYPPSHIRDERQTFRGTTRICRKPAHSSGADTPQTDNGVTRPTLLALLRFQAAAPGRKPVCCTHGDPTSPRSLKCKPTKGSPIAAFEYYGSIIPPEFSFCKCFDKISLCLPLEGEAARRAGGVPQKTTVRPRPKEGFSQNLPLRERRPAERRDGRGVPWAEIVCVFLTVSARYAPPQSGLRPASSPVWEAFGPAENLRLHSAQRVDGVQVCGLGGGQ